MSEKTERRTIQKDVVVFTCDGPECIAEIVSDRGASGLWNHGWHTLQLLDSFDRSDPTRDMGPWHFHQVKCILAWARLKTGIPLELHQSSPSL